MKLIPSATPFFGGGTHRSTFPTVQLGRGFAATVGLAGTLVALTGCQSYERRPLDMDGTRNAWLTRSPADPSVLTFARTLSQTESNAAYGTFDPSDGLTLAEAEAVALVFSPDLRLARLEANVTRATAAHAGLWQDPVLGVDMERVVSGAGGANPWVVGSTLGLTIPISGRLHAEKARAGALTAGGSSGHAAVTAANSGSTETGKLVS